MMSTIAKHPDITPIPVQLSEPEFNECIFPHLSMPTRGPTCKIGYHCLFNLILWVLDTGMPWKCLPMLKEAHGKPELHDTNVYRAFATWADDGSLQQAFMASTAWQNQLFGLACPPPNICSQPHHTWQQEEHRCANHEVPAPP